MEFLTLPSKFVKKRNELFEVAEEEGEINIISGFSGERIEQ